MVMRAKRPTKTRESTRPGAGRCNSAHARLWDGSAILFSFSDLRTQRRNLPRDRHYGGDKSRVLRIGRALSGEARGSAVVPDRDLYEQVLGKLRSQGHCIGDVSSVNVRFRMAGRAQSRPSVPGILRRQAEIASRVSWHQPCSADLLMRLKERDAARDDGR